MNKEIKYTVYHYSRFLREKIVGNLHKSQIIFLCTMRKVFYNKKFRVVLLQNAFFYDMIY